ncbi:MAG: hypothetical protein M0Z37_06125 [Nitrospiraceae bacterium]|nr:hypothetical protein [Nitrospiraceae bacterium]
MARTSQGVGSGAHRSGLTAAGISFLLKKAASKGRERSGYQPRTIAVISRNTIVSTVSLSQGGYLQAIGSK